MTDYSDHIGPYWPGYPGIANLIIFGDSYSSIGYPDFYPRPDKDHPLGSPAPSYFWTESATKPNWVGHLVEKHKPNPDLLVYDYAVGGDDAAGLGTVEEWQHTVRYVRGSFLLPDGKVETRTPNDPQVTWIGINDCARLSSDQAIGETQQKLFNLQQELYEEGARNFMFIDVPPMEKTPAFRKGAGSLASYAYEGWNKMLRKNVTAFLSENEDTTTMVLSSSEFFNVVFKTPSRYGFEEEDIRKRYGPVWADEIHPTSRMHELFAERVSEFLSSYPVDVSAQTD